MAIPHPLGCSGASPRAGVANRHDGGGRPDGSPQVDRGSPKVHAAATAAGPEGDRLRPSDAPRADAALPGQRTTACKNYITNI